jgi:hypothetical protein
MLVKSTLEFRGVKIKQDNHCRLRSPKKDVKIVIFEFAGQDIKEIKYPDNADNLYLKYYFFNNFKRPLSFPYKFKKR